MPLRMLIFLTVFTVLYSSIQFYLYRKYRNWLRQLHPARYRQWLWVGRGILVISLLAVPLRWLISRYWGYQNTPAQLMIYLAGTLAAMLITAFLILLVKDLFDLLFRWGGRFREWLFRNSVPVKAPPRRREPLPVDYGRRRLLKLGGSTIIGVSMGAPILAKLSTEHDYHVRRVPLYFPNLPAQLEGFTIAQVSDIHSGVFMTENQIRDIFTIVNRLHPNLVALTGDFVDNNNSEIPSLYRTIGELRSDYGSFGCLGNHDHFANVAKVTDALLQRGVTMLNNANQTLDIDGARLTLVGIDDAGRGGFNFARFDHATAGLPEDSFKVFLAHRPGAFLAAKKLGFDLTLSGHTHGGQIIGKVGGMEINPIRLMHPYVEGLYKEEGKQLYVNVGVGMVGVPIRLVPREITLLSLHRGENKGENV